MKRKKLNKHLEVTAESVSDDVEARWRYHEHHLIGGHDQDSGNSLQSAAINADLSTEVAYSNHRPGQVVFGEVGVADVARLDKNLSTALRAVDRDHPRRA